MHIGEIHQNVLADMEFSSLKAKWHSIVVVGGEDDVYWFARIRVVFQLKVPSANAWKENYAFFRHFDISGLVYQVDHVLDCVCLWLATQDEKGYNRLRFVVREQRLNWRLVWSVSIIIRGICASFYLL